MCGQSPPLPPPPVIPQAPPSSQATKKDSPAGRDNSVASLCFRCAWDRRLGGSRRRGNPGSGDVQSRDQRRRPGRVSGHRDRTRETLKGGESSGRPAAPSPRGAEATGDRCKAETGKTIGGQCVLLALGVALPGDGPRPELSIKSTGTAYRRAGYRWMAAALRICNGAGRRRIAPTLPSGPVRAASGIARKVPEIKPFGGGRCRLWSVPGFFRIRRLTLPTSSPSNHLENQEKTRNRPL